MNITKKSFNKLLSALLMIGIISSNVACGSLEETTGAQNTGTGSYAARLIIPPDIPRLESNTEFSLKAVSKGIDCEGYGIETIRCRLFAADGVSIIKENTWPCNQNQGLMDNIPPGSGITSVVTAEDRNGTVILKGEDYDIVIEAGRQTVGRDIVLGLVDVNPPPVVSIDQLSPVNLDDDETSTLITGTITAESGLREVWIRVSAGSTLISNNHYETFDSEPIIYDDARQYAIHLNVDNIDSDTSVILYAVDNLNQQSDEMEIIIHPAGEIPDDDDPPAEPPTVSIDRSSPIDLDYDETSALITGTITAEAGLREVSIRVSEGSTLVSNRIHEAPFDSEPIIYDDTRQYVIHLNVDNIDSDTSVILYAVDDLGQQSDRIEVRIHPAVSIPLRTFRIALGAQSNDLGSCASLTHKRVYLFDEWAQNCSDIDIFYYMASPQWYQTLYALDSTALHHPDTGIPYIRDRGWASYNATQLDHTNLSPSAFDDIDNVHQLPNVPDPNSDHAETLAVDDVLAFRTVSGHRGVIMVTGLVTGQQGYIELFVKVEP